MVETRRRKKKMGVSWRSVHERATLRLDCGFASEESSAEKRKAKLRPYKNGSAVCYHFNKHTIGHAEKERGAQKDCRTSQTPFRNEPGMVQKQDHTQTIAR